MSAKRAAAEAGPAHQKRRTEPDEEYPLGSIMRVKLINIQVCTELEVFPGPGLNLVVGPNGAGKSTVVAGIFLCLGGDVKLIDRHPTVTMLPQRMPPRSLTTYTLFERMGPAAGGYVKTGSDHGMIEVELSGGERDSNVVVRREIYKNKPTAKYYFINDKKVNEADVHVLTQKLKIRIENLCQFLPQDRVSEFAKMSPQEVLRATEEAIGGAEMVERHDRINRLGEKERDMQNKFEEHTENAAGLEKQESVLRKDYDRFKDREQQMANIELLEQKLNWKRYTVAFDKHAQKKMILEEKRAALKAANDNLGPDMKRLEAVETNLKSKSTKKKELEKILGTSEKQCEHMQLKAERADEDLEDCRIKLTDCERRLRSHRNNLAKYQSQVKNFEKEITEARESEDSDLIAKIQQAKCESRQATQKLIAIQKNRSENRRRNVELVGEVTEIKKNQTELENIRKQSEEYLRKRAPDVYKGLRWLRENTDKFKMKVFEPTLLQVDIPEKRDANFVEAAIAIKDLKAFVVQCKEDQDILLQNLKDHQKLKVNVLMAPKKDCQSRLKNPQAMSKYGRVRLLSTMLQAPAPVMRVLCENSRIHEVPVFDSEDVVALGEKLFFEHGVTRYFTPRNRHICRRSKYGQRNVQSDQYPVRQSSLFSKSIDQSERQRLRDELQRLNREMEERKDEDARLENEEKVTAKEKSLKDEMLTELKKQKHKVETLQQKLRRSRDSTAKCEAAITDAENAVATAENDVRTAANHYVRQTLQLKESVKRFVETTYGLYDLTLVIAQLSRQEKGLSDALEGRRAEVKELKDQVDNAKQEKRLAVQEAKQLLEIAQKLSKEKGMLDPEGQEPSRELNASFGLFEEDEPEAIQGRIHEEKAKLECTANTGVDIVDQYKRVKRKLNEAYENIAKCQESHKEAQDVLEKEKALWLPQLKDITRTASEKFSEMFANLGFSGEVKLHEDDHDYSQFGLEIWVDFKGGQMHLLKAEFQSGGEKMVSTMIFLLALQTLSSVPFRLVDEINQGMDQRNERLVFTQVVHCSELNGKSQYFMVTPKLLPELPYSESMRIICVFNGPWIKARELSAKGSNFFSDVIDKKRRMLRVSSS